MIDGFGFEHCLDGRQFFHYLDDREITRTIVLPEDMINQPLLLKVSMEWEGWRFDYGLGLCVFWVEKCAVKGM